jgi:serine/threonine-protein kinase
MLIPEYRGGAIEEYIPLARQAAERAMALRPDSARALTTLANIKAQYDYDFAGANADFARAIELEPGYATAHQWYSEILTAQRRFDEALEQADLAIEADPRSVVVATARGNALMGVRRLDEAAAQFQAVRVLDPQSPLPPANLLYVYQLQGQYAQARILSAEVAQMHPYGFDGAADLALIDAMENPALKPSAIELIQQSPIMYDGADSRALYFALLGEYELAMDNLEKGFAVHDPSTIYMNRWPMYEPLRDNPRFQALLQKMNLWP